MSTRAVECQTDLTWLASASPKQIPHLKPPTVPSKPPRPTSTASSQTVSPRTNPNQVRVKSAKQVPLQKTSTKLAPSVQVPKSPKASSSSSHPPTRVRKGDHDPVALYNKYDGLDEMDMSDSAAERTLSLSPGGGRHQSKSLSPSRRPPRSRTKSRARGRRKTRSPVKPPTSI